MPRLASFTSEYACYQIEAFKGYDMNKLKKNLQSTARLSLDRSSLSSKVEIYILWSMVILIQQNRDPHFWTQRCSAHLQAFPLQNSGFVFAPPILTGGFATFAGVLLPVLQEVLSHLLVYKVCPIFPQDEV